MTLRIITEHIVIMYFFIEQQYKHNPISTEKTILASWYLGW